MTYVTDTPYEDTFFRELSPAWLNYVAALNGVPPQRLDGQFHYLELGCGLATSTVVLAAAFPDAVFHGCDLNDSHIATGRTYAARLGVTNVELHACSFAEIVDKALPRFHFIVLHGVYSWVDAATRAVIGTIIQRLLLPGGFVYVSYNALPGWAHELPLRKLLIELGAAVTGSAGERSMSAATQVQRLDDAGFRYFTTHPAVRSAVQAYARGDGPYLAHEFMNAAWEPFYAVDVADEMMRLGLEHVGSATLVDNHLPLIVDSRASEVVGALPSQRARQLAIDFATNQRFRRDVFVAGGSASRDTTHLDGVPVGCAREIDGIATVVRVPRGEIRFQDPFIQDVRRVMSRGSCTFGDLLAELHDGSHDRSAIARNLLFLIAGGALVPCAREFTAPAATPSRLSSPVVEAALAEAAEREKRRAVIPSVVYGNGVELDANAARALLQWSRDGSTGAEVATMIATFGRLGLVA